MRSSRQLSPVRQHRTGRRADQGVEGAPDRCVRPSSALRSWSRCFSRTPRVQPHPASQLRPASADALRADQLPLALAGARQHPDYAGLLGASAGPDRELGVGAVRRLEFGRESGPDLFRAFDGNLPCDTTVVWQQSKLTAGRGEHSCSAVLLNCSPPIVHVQWSGLAGGQNGYLWRKGSHPESCSSCATTQ